MASHLTQLTEREMCSPRQPSKGNGFLSQKCCPGRERHPSLSTNDGRKMCIFKPFPKACPPVFFLLKPQKGVHDIQAEEKQTEASRDLY